MNTQLTRDDNLSHVFIPTHGGADPEGQNDERTERGDNLATLYQGLTNADDEDLFADMLADLMHYAARIDVDFAKELSRAARNFMDETHG